MPEIPTIKYNRHQIYDPAATPFVERNEFMQRVCGAQVQVNDVAIEQRILTAWRDRLRGVGAGAKIEVDASLARMARDYSRYLKSGARLPKFTRWCSSMFPGDATLNAKLAAVGQAKGQAGEYSFSTKLYDILRAGASPYFYSCFVPGGMGGQSLQRIAKDAPGIAIVYQDDPATGYMKGRAWLYHAKRNGNDCVVISNPYGHLDITAIAASLRARGFDVYCAERYTATKNGYVEVKYQDVGTEFYNDINLWCTPTYAKPIQ